LRKRVTNAKNEEQLGEEPMGQSQQLTISIYDNTVTMHDFGKQFM
jgi:hypothetical protein